MRRGERFGPLRERPFRLLWLGRTGSGVGDSLVPVALIWAVFDVHGSKLALGIVVACYTIGRLMTFAGGVWADRLPRRAVMISADLVRFCTQTTTAALLLTGSAHVWELGALQLVAGSASGFFNPAATALVPQAVSAGRLQQANSLLSMSRSATSIFGPAASGAIVAAASPGWCFAIDAASFLVSVAFVTAMDVAEYVRPARQRFLHELADGWREVRRHRWLTAGFLGFALGNVGIGIYLVLGSVVARDHLGGSEAWGLIVMSGSIGGVLGGLVAYRIHPRHPVAAAFAIWPASAMLPFALVGPLRLPLIMAAGGVTFAAILVGNALWETAMQQEVLPSRLARVVSIDLLLSVCLMPAGEVLAGPVSNILGTPETLALSGVLMCVPNLLVLGFVREVRSVQRRDEPQPAPAS